MRSKGVGCGALGSGLDLAGELLLEFRPSCIANCQITFKEFSQLMCRGSMERTALLFSFPKNEDIVHALHLQLADE